MSSVKFKINTVIIDGGSGVLYQPYDNTEYTYLLSAKHNFYTRNGLPKTIKESVKIYFYDDQDTEVPVNIILGSNYFEHTEKTIDAAILKIDYRGNIEELFADEDCNAFGECFLCGFPGNLRNNQNDKYTTYNIKHKIDTTQNGGYLRLQSDFGTLTHEDFLGFSGGGIFRENNSSLNLIGIQSSTTTNYANGQIDIIPASSFNEIAVSNNLPELLPGCLTGIPDLIDNVLKFELIIPELRPKLINAIKGKLDNIKLRLVELYNNDISEKLSISKDAKKSKKFWESFLEYILIINIIQDEQIDEITLKKIINSKKFVFSNTDQNFLEIIRDVLQMDLTEIEENCQILIGSGNVPATKRRVSANDIVTNISDATQYYTIDRAIHLKRIKEIIHIKAIEFDCINPNENNLNGYSHLQLIELLEEIKKIINDFLST